MIQFLKTKKNIVLESHPEDYNGYPFISLVQYRKTTNYVCIIDNVTNKQLKAFVLDLCDSENINEHHIIDVAVEWYDKGKPYPISIEFAKKDICHHTSRIYKSMSLDTISRIIGDVSYYDTNVKQVKKRKRRAIASSIVDPSAADQHHLEATSHHFPYRVQLQEFPR